MASQNHHDDTEDDDGDDNEVGYDDGSKAKIRETVAYLSVRLQQMMMAAPGIF